jgi:pyruvate dehydrogenase E2 component (dihydrolipoamide acetyltransferase)
MSSIIMTQKKTDLNKNANRYNIDPAQLAASHIEDHVTTPTAHPVEIDDTHLPFGMIRQIIAERLTLSKQTIPHFHLTVDVDMTNLLNWRKQANQDSDAKITITDLVIKAVADSLVQYERINAHVESDKLIIKKDVNIGLVVAIDDGLMVPVITHADQKTLQEISQASRTLSQAARNLSINFDDVATFTISTLGAHGIKNFQTIINPPECAILSVGAIEERVAAFKGEIKFRNIMSLNLAVDHRAIDGTYAAGFLNAIKARLENSD